MISYASRNITATLGYTALVVKDGIKWITSKLIGNDFHLALFIKNIQLKSGALHGYLAFAVLILTTASLSSKYLTYNTAIFLAILAIEVVTSLTTIIALSHYDTKYWSITNPFGFGITYLHFNPQPDGIRINEAEQELVEIIKIIKSANARILVLESPLLIRDIARKRVLRTLLRASKDKGLHGVVMKDKEIHLSYWQRAVAIAFHWKYGRLSKEFRQHGRKRSRLIKIRFQTI